MGGTCKQGNLNYETNLINLINNEAQLTYSTNDEDYYRNIFNNIIKCLNSMVIND